ncbi:MAG: sulfatase-like hydrolase/transferase [Acidobacteria bacterium]|nr:sulfatase-like hydrolase/transferase [Acidobacteriota bacterium]
MVPGRVTERPSASVDPPYFGLGFLSILLPTLIVKRVHLLTLYRGDLSGVLRWILVDPSPWQKLLYATSFFARDVAEVFVIWSAFYLLARKLLRLRPSIVTGVGAGFALLVTGANYMTFRELGTFLTLDVLLISVEWTSRNPEIVRQYVSIRSFAVLPVAAAWIAVPVAVPPRLARWARGRWLTRALSPAALALAAAAAAGLSYASSEIAFGGKLPHWGYWSASASAFFEVKERRGKEVDLVGIDALRRQFHSISYPEGEPPPAPGPAEIPAPLRVPHHVVIIAMETASREYYPFLDDPNLPTFHRMQRRAFTSTRHFTTRTSTTWSAYSILTGVYPPTRRDVLRYGPYEGDGLAALLAPRGYEATFIDSYNIDFHERDMKSQMWTDIGFTTLLDPDRFPAAPARNVYEKHLSRDERSFTAVRDAVLGAQSRGKKAVVFLSTMLGHYEWKAKPGHESLSGRERLYQILVEYDRMLGGVLDALEKAALGDDLLVVVTGDHGLRNQAEFDSLGEPMLLGRAAFNVPFMLYAPSLLDHEVRVPYATSHVDIAPTILDLTGTDASASFFHGESLLTARLASRAVFLMNTGLNPTDGYFFKGRFFTYNSLSEMREVAREETSPEPRMMQPSGAEAEAIPEALRDPKKFLERGRESFERAARYFAAKRKQGT